MRLGLPAHLAAATWLQDVGLGTTLGFHVRSQLLQLFWQGKGCGDESEVLGKQPGHG